MRQMKQFGNTAFSCISFFFLRTQSAEGTTGKEYRAYQSPSRKVW